MKKQIIKSSIVSGLATLAVLMPASWKQQSLPSVVKTHLGVYQCQEATLDDKDLLPYCKDLSLELKDKNTYILHYKMKGKKPQKVQGEYAYDVQKGEIVLTFDGGKKRVFPLKNGQLQVYIPLGDKCLKINFQQK